MDRTDVLGGQKCSGCEARKEVMFTQGKPGTVEVVLVSAAVLALVASFIIMRKGKAS